MRSTLLAAVALAAALTVLATGGAAGAVAQDAPDERVVVDVESDGDATVTTVYTYDLDDDRERSAFESLEDDRSSIVDGYEQRLAGVAAGVSEDTGREMAIRDVQATVERRDDVGVVRLTVTWTNLAAENGDELVLAAPFDEGFDPDRPLVVRAPDGEEIADTSVEPTEHSDGQATWSTDRDLSGFRATMTAGDGGDGALAPSLLVPLLGLLAGGGLLAVRRGTDR